MSFIVLSSTVSANTCNSEWIVKLNNKGEKEIINTVTNEIVTNYYNSSSDGNNSSISPEQMVEILNTPEQNTNESSDFNSESISTYEVPTSYSQTSFSRIWIDYVYGPSVKVTNDVIGKMQITSSCSRTFSSSFGASLEMSLDLRNNIIASLDGRYESSLTSTTSYTAEIPSGYIGHIAFKPVYLKSYGTATRKTYSMSGYLLNTQTFEAYGQTPVKLANGSLDGVYYTVSRKL
ncbi:MAG: hypothetical protein RSG07_04455 [Erysipelotrichaceae bacterium]